MKEIDDIRFMKARIIRLASEEWGKSIEEIVDLFDEYSVLEYITEGYGIFHVEGDYAVLEDIREYLNNRGLDIDD